MHMIQCTMLLRLLLAFCFVLATAASCPALQQTSFAVLPMEASEGVTTAEKEEAESTLSEVLIQSAKYKLVERSRIDQILSEQNLQRTGATDSGRAAAVGRVLGVDKLIQTTIYRKEALTIKISVIDVATSRVELTKVKFLGKAGPRAVARWAAAEVLMRYPLLGAVTGKAGDLLFIDLGEGHGIRAGSRIFVAEKTVLRDDSGRQLISDYRRVGLLKVTRATRDGSQAAEIELRDRTRPVSTGDIVSVDPIPASQPVISKTPLLASVKAGRLLLDDDMKARKYLSPTSSRGDSYHEGELHLNATALKVYHAWAFYPVPFDQLGDFILEGEIEFQKQSRRSGGIDICFRSNGVYTDLSAYRLFLGNDGKFEVRLSRYGARFGVVPLQATPLLRRGAEKNRFRIVARGAKFDIYVNDAFLIAFEDELMEAGSIGFMVEAGGYVTLDNVKVWEAVLQ